MSVSVLIPAYNAAAHLEVTLPAVLALEGVTEWIWVDDGSVDDTAARIEATIASEPRARLIRHATNLGRAAARNTALEAAAGDIVALLDADAAPRPRYIRTHLDALRAPDAIATVARVHAADPVAGDPYSVYLRDRPRGPSAASGPTPWRHFVTCAVCVEAASLRQAGGFDTRVGYGEDAALACVLASTHPDGLHVAGGAAVDLYGTEGLDGALAKTGQFGASLVAIEAATPGAIERLGLGRLRSPRIRALVASSGPAALVRKTVSRWPRRLVPAGVRYLLAHALARGYTDARPGFSPDP